MFVFFLQLDGLAMGSSPAPHLADGWLSQFESTIRGTAVLYSRYMDDIICSIENNNIDSHLTMINSIHPKLKFTHETPKNGSLPFLDMEIINNNGCLSSRWYRKPTDTGLTLNFHSLAPLKYKKSVIISFVYRIYRACTSWLNFHEGISQAKNILMNNQYPESFIDKYIKETLHKLLADPDSESDSVVSNTSVSIDTSIDSNACLNQFNNKDKFKFFITYRGKPTEQLAKSFRKLNAPCILIMTLDKTKNVLPSLKPSVPKMLQNNAVYQIKCSRCGSSYVGQTSRHLQQRFREHVGNKGPIKTHFFECNINATENDISILGKSRGGENKLLTLEALFIKEINPILNTKDEYKSRTLTLKF